MDFKVISIDALAASPLWGGRAHALGHAAHHSHLSR